MSEVLQILADDAHQSGREGLRGVRRLIAVMGAATDVLDFEPMRPTDPLVPLARIVLTRHSAAYSGQSLQDIRRAALADVVNVLTASSPERLALRRMA